MKNTLFTFLTVLLFSFGLNGQQSFQKLITDHIDQNHILPSEKTTKNWRIYDWHYSKADNLTFVYVRQLHQGVEIYKALGQYAIKDDSIVSAKNNFIKNPSKTAKAISPKISALQALKNASKHFKLGQIDHIEAVGGKNNQHFKFKAPEISRSVVPINLMLFSLNDEKIIPVWNLSIEAKNGAHWWSVRVNAVNGSIIDTLDWVRECNFGAPEHSNHKKAAQKKSFSKIQPPPPSTPIYNVFAIPVESPIHGNRSLVTSPSDPTASPHQWHDIDGASGAEFQNTRGNNVFASEDPNDNDNFNYGPSGGSQLNFDFPLNLNQQASGYLDPAITNLFYMNNIMHDVFYHYGFDEASGNFQANNYGNGGLDQDHVNADAQDGGGTNNANFATPPDGNNPRMQMYLWNSSNNQLLTVNSPSNLAGSYTAEEASFGPGVPTSPITSDLVLYEDNVFDYHDACETPINGNSFAGKIVVIRRGQCTFVDKIERAENNGATAVIMADTVANSTPVTMGGNGNNIGIPSVAITKSDGTTIINTLQSGTTINATLVKPSTNYQDDGDFDNGIIAHEYGHGISNRLTGGASNTNCLDNDEQMGEGWSDWMGLILTIEPGDQASDSRPLGTFAKGQTPSGTGLRLAPYSTDMNINGYTYASTNNSGSVSEPHGIGFIWATMLWDLTWAMIDRYGYDPDLYTGTGGNNKMMQLVITGMKLQPCEPGFVDGRDAILQADQILYNGENECLIWNVFANRGLGESADQGSTSSRTDQVEAFDIPASLNNVSGSESISACGSYTWSATGQTYSNSGTYTATLFANNGCDSTAELNLTVNSTPIANVNYGSSSSLTLESANTASSYQWVDCNNNYAPIQGETSATLSPNSNGDYALIVSNGNCSDTSNCKSIFGVGINELTAQDIEMYPNPFDEMLTIDFGQTVNDARINVMTVTGQKVASKNINAQSKVQLQIDDAAGIYIVEILSENFILRRKVNKID